jgi:hypothetical protein
MEKNLNDFEVVHNVHFETNWQTCEKRLLDPLCLSVRPSVRMEQLGSNWTHFHKISSLILLNSVGEIQVSLKSDKNNEYFT